MYAYGTARYRRNARMPYELTNPPPPGSAEFSALVEGITGASVRSGNRVRILRNGAQTFPAMLETIASAQSGGVGGRGGGVVRVGQRVTSVAACWTRFSRRLGRRRDRRRSVDRRA